MSSTPRNNTTAASVPWADLLPEMCGVVVDRLDAMTALKFPCVCTPWLTACREAPRLRSGFPTMLTSGLDDSCRNYTVYDYEEGVFALHDVSTGKSFPAEAEGLMGRCWVGGKHDWLVTTDADCTVELLNPVTGARSSPLPSFSTIPGVKVNGEFDVRVEGEIYPQKLQRIALCQTPVHQDGYLAVAMFSPNLLAFTRYGDEFWTALKNPAVAEEGGIVIRYADTIVHEEKVIAVSQAGAVYSWELNGGKTADPTVLREPDVSGPVQHKFNLATSSGGRRLLLICMYGETTWEDRPLRRKIYDGKQENFRPFDVVLEELDTGDSTWRRVRDIGGDSALFLGANYPFYIVVPPGSKGLKANCIYVADMANSEDATVIDMDKMGRENTFIRRLHYPGESDAFQTPIWFRPTSYLQGLVSSE